MSVKYSDQQIEDFIKNGQVEPYYQPIRKNKEFTSTYKKFEILARIDISIGKGELKELSPYFFIKTAKKLGIYHLVTEQIILKSFARIKALVEKYSSEDFKFSINIQIEDIKNEKTVQLIKNEIVGLGIEKNIIFELSEEDSLTGDNIEKTKEFMKTFKDLGSEFALDDFGTGYSSFHPLIEFNFDYIKLDQVLIQNIYEDPKKYYLCDMLVEFSKRNKLVTIAEYVEDIEHEKALEAIGVEYYQGYKYSKAIKNIEELIA